MSVSGSLSAWRGDIPTRYKGKTDAVGESKGIVAINEQKLGFSATELMISGALSGMISCACLQPFDVIKTRQQECTTKILSLRNATTRVLQFDGVFGLWRGLTPALIRIAPGAGLYFYSLDSLQSLYPTFLKESKNYFSVDTSNASENPPIWYKMCASSISRAFSVSLLCPATVVKTRMESTWAERPAVGGSLISTISLVASHEGFFAFYRGLIPTLLRDLPFSGIYFGLYEKLKEVCCIKDKSIPYYSSYNFLCSFLAGGIASLITHPADVLRTRMQLHGTLNSNDNRITVDNFNLCNLSKLSHKTAETKHLSVTKRNLCTFINPFWICGDLTQKEKRNRYLKLFSKKIPPPYSFLVFPSDKCFMSNLSHLQGLREKKTSVIKKTGYVLSKEENISYKLNEKNAFKKSSQQILLVSTSNSPIKEIVKNLKNSKYLACYKNNQILTNFAKNMLSTMTAARGRYYSSTIKVQTGEGTHDHNHKRKVFEQKFKVQNSRKIIDDSNNIYDKNVGKIKLCKLLIFIIKSEGWRALFKGLMPRLIKRTLMTAITWTTYDEINKFIKT